MTAQEIREIEVFVGNHLMDCIHHFPERRLITADYCKAEWSRMEMPKSISEDPWTDELALLAIDVAVSSICWASVANWIKKKAVILDDSGDWD